MIKTIKSIRVSFTVYINGKLSWNIYLIVLLLVACVVAQWSTPENIEIAWRRVKIFV
jgi:hypothetical protein